MADWLPRLGFTLFPFIGAAIGRAITFPFIGAAFGRAINKKKQDWLDIVEDWYEVRRFEKSKIKEW